MKPIVTKYRDVYYVQVGIPVAGSKNLNSHYKISPGITANAFIRLKLLKKFDDGTEVYKPLRKIININRDNY